MKETHIDVIKEWDCLVVLTFDSRLKASWSNHIVPSLPLSNPDPHV